ncbi:MAG: hypothetical protein FWE87_03365 [Coriobacteriia bacterium]|nr:hypothetical protein [Coriobacteriia bacterium]
MLLRSSHPRHTYLRMLTLLVFALVLLLALSVPAFAAERKIVAMQSSEPVEEPWIQTMPFGAFWFGKNVEQYNPDELDGMFFIQLFASTRLYGDGQYKNDHNPLMAGTSMIVTDPLTDGYEFIEGYCGGFGSITEADGIVTWERDASTFDPRTPPGGTIGWGAYAWYSVKLKDSVVATGVYETGHPLIATITPNTPEDVLMLNPYYYLVPQQISAEIVAGQLIITMDGVQHSFPAPPATSFSSFTVDGWVIAIGVQSGEVSHCQILDYEGDIADLRNPAFQWDGAQVIESLSVFGSTTVEGDNDKQEDPSKDMEGSGRKESTIPDTSDSALAIFAPLMLALIGSVALGTSRYYR